MKKRIISLVCVITLLYALLPATAPAEAAEGGVLYFMALNETILDLTDETMPCMINGTLYVPYTMFDASVTTPAGINLSSIYSRTKGKLILYRSGQILEFDLKNDTATFQGAVCQAKAVIRNSVVFVSLDAVCKLYDLDWSWIIMERGYVIRVKSADAVLTDQGFVNSAGYALETRYQRYLQSKAAAETPVAVPEPSPSPSPTTPSPVETSPVESQPSGNSGTETVLPAEGAVVYLAFRMEEGEGFTELLSQLERSGVYAVFFCTVEHLAERDDAIRTLLATGHRIGLLLDGTTLAEQQEQLARGNELLSRIAHTETVLVLSEGLTRSERAELEQSVCLWATTRSAESEGRTQEKQEEWAINGVSAGEVCFLLMEDSAQSARALKRILTQLSARGAELRLATEVVLQNQ